MVDDDDIQEVVPVKTEPASSSGAGGGGLSDGGGVGAAGDAVIAGNLVEHHDAADNAAVAVDANEYDDPTMIDPETAIEETYGEENFDYGAYEESYDESGGMIDPAMPIAAAGADGNKGIVHDFHISQYLLLLAFGMKV